MNNQCFPFRAAFRLSVLNYSVLTWPQECLKARRIQNSQLEKWRLQVAENFLQRGCGAAWRLRRGRLSPSLLPPPHNKCFCHPLFFVSPFFRFFFFFLSFATFCLNTPSRQKHRWEKHEHSSCCGAKRREDRRRLLLPYGVENPSDAETLRNSNTIAYNNTIIAWLVGMDHWEMNQKIISHQGHC